MGSGLSALGWRVTHTGSEWGFYVLCGMSIATGALLFVAFRRALSYVLSVIETVVSGQILKLKKEGTAPFPSERVLVPTSVPHMVALWIYVITAGFLLSSVDPSGMTLPSLPMPIPVPLDQLFSYNGLGLVLLAFCGVGIVITRKPVEALQRLGLVKPTLAHLGTGLLLILMTFSYDYLWSMFTHQMGGDLASKLTGYNAGTFNSGGTLGSSAFLALATGLCAGIGEETLIRGALQPAFGILPAALLHGLLHGQFSHAPIFILQVAGWSAVMGIVRRYTNTTTTIIGHAGFNFVTTFLFAFNP
jgi:uncharacterized protein